jgi:MinD-like ATPase involved in chromosome partitioning or flagellar assembly
MTATEHYVLVGVARARDRWSADLARWSTSGAAPIEFVKCLTADEARAVLGSGRRASALMLDARGPGVDRDLIASAADLDVPTIIVTDRSVHHDWDALGCAAIVDHRLELQPLLDTLARHTVTVDRSRRPGRASIRRESHGSRSTTVAVLGSGGSGASTVAMATAQALAQVASDTGRVVLVDGARRGCLAMYHHIGDVIPGLPELVDAHRSDQLDPDEVRRLTYAVPTRGYSVLLGRRRAADWVTLRRRSVDASLDGLARAFDAVVMDLDADLDGQVETGSPDVEDRHAVTLVSLERADLVLVVGRPDLHGIHSLAAILQEVLDAGVPPHRVLPVVTESPRSPAGRASITATIADLADTSAGGDGQRMGPVLHLRRVRALDDLHDRVGAFPPALCRPLGRQVLHLLAATGPRPRHEDQIPIRPGDLATSERPMRFRAAGGPRSEVA